GIGMEAAFLPHLFDAFKQESSGYSRSHEGSGLGLTIVKRVVELLGGRIAVESRRGAGSLFEVVLPRHPAGGDGATRRGGVPAPSMVSESLLSGARVLALAPGPETRERLEAVLGTLCTLVPVEAA